MAPRTLVRFDQIRRAERIDSPAVEGLYARGRYFEADCLATDLVGHCVIVTGPAVGGISQVTKIDITTTGLTKPAVGIIGEKSTATRCLVVTVGELAVVPAVLLPGTPYWIGTDGFPTSVLPVPDPGTRIATQIIGSAIDTGRLLINPERRPIIRTG